MTKSTDKMQGIVWTFLVGLMQLVKGEGEPVTLNQLV